MPRAAAVALLCSLIATAQEQLTFQGRKVTIEAPPMLDEFTPGGPATICLDGPPSRRCYTAPKGQGRNPNARVVQLGVDNFAILFVADSGGVSGFVRYIALLQPGDHAELEDILGVEVLGQGQHEFLTDDTISPAPIFVTASYIWGRDESHFEPHRFIVSAYTLQPSRYPDLPTAYYLADQYMTVAHYAYGDDDILAAERPEILARLRRIAPAPAKQ